MFSRPGGDGDLDLGVCGGELGEGMAEEGAIYRSALSTYRKIIARRQSYFMPLELPAQSQ